MDRAACRRTGIRGFARATRRGGRLAGLLLVLVGLAVPPAAANLLFFDQAAGPGGVRLFSSPISNQRFDIAFQPTSAEGGGVYGFSEARFVTTGDLEFEATGFSCLATACLFFPFPFVKGKEILVTGGEDLLGEFGAISDVMTILVSGSTGLVLLMESDYVDATGMGMAPGAIRAADPSLIALVPEPAAGTGLGIGLLAAAALSRRRLRATTARASSRSGGGPAGRSPPGR